MKYLYFIKWSFDKVIGNIRSWDRWLWLWAITCAWGPTAIMNKDSNPDNFHAFTVFVLIFWVGYGLIYTGIKRAYNKFLQEQEKIVNHLKDIV